MSPPATPVDASTFEDAWSHAVADGPDAPFLVFERSDGETTSWTYAEFDHVVDRAAGALADRGVTHGAAVHLALTNSPAFVAVWLAALRLGAWIVPSDPQGRAVELAGHLERTGAVVGVCSELRRDEYDAAIAQIPQRLSTIVVHEDDTDLSVFGSTERPRAMSRPGPRDRASVMFTSGTTGRPKGVEITQANYAFAGRVMAEAAGLQAHHRQLVVLPLFHANAQYYSFASAIWAGASVALMHTFSASRFLQQAATHRATHASLFAAPLRMILARGATPVTDLRLEHCWYAMNISDDQHEVVSGLFGCRPRQLYGMTETIPAVLTDRPGEPVASSMGFVTGGCVVDVQRADGSTVEAGEIGEIVVGGEPGITLFAGYLDDPDTTSASYRNGWFLTGDRATRDEDGRHAFDGRRSDVLKVAGENVSTVEVEQVLAAHPDVLEVAVVGMPDPIRDEVPVAFVVPNDPSAPPSPEVLSAWCEERLAKSKRPREIRLVSELPRTSVGKIRKFLLKDPSAEVRP